jgi:hypothetical protein
MHDEACTTPDAAPSLFHRIPLKFLLNPVLRTRFLAVFRPDFEPITCVRELGAGVASILAFETTDASISISIQSQLLLPLKDIAATAACIAQPLLC